MRSLCRAGVTRSNYVSYMVSPYNCWFAAFGYPNLDVQLYEDGEWSIIQYLRSPVVPAVTPWNHVLMGMRHVEINPWVLKKYAEQLDAEKRHVWDELEKDEREAIRQAQSEERYALDSAAAKHQAIVNNPDLMERIARNGLQEMNVWRVGRHVPKHHFRKK